MEMPDEQSPQGLEGAMPTPGQLTQAGPKHRQGSGHKHQAGTTP